MNYQQRSLIGMLHLGKEASVLIEQEQPAAILFVRSGPVSVDYSCHTLAQIRKPTTSEGYDFIRAVPPEALEGLLNTMMGPYAEPNDSLPGKILVLKAQAESIVKTSGALDGSQYAVFAHKGRLRSWDLAEYQAQLLLEEPRALLLL